MKILVVEDNKDNAQMLRLHLKSKGELPILVLSDESVVSEVLHFGIDFDIALVDLRLKPDAGDKLNHGGLRACETIRTYQPNTVIVGYSSFFDAEDDAKEGEFEAMKNKFIERGADKVLSLNQILIEPPANLFSLVLDRDKSKANKQKMFIGSSVEGIHIAESLQSLLRYNFDVDIWSQGSFTSSQSTTMEDLEKVLSRYSCGVFVFTADDVVEKRGKTTKIPRDNVVFEAGLFVGACGRENTFLIVDKTLDDHALPSDLKGVGREVFDATLKGGDLNSELGPAATGIKTTLLTLSK